MSAPLRLQPGDTVELHYGPADPHPWRWTDVWIEKGCAYGTPDEYTRKRGGDETFIAAVSRIEADVAAPELCGEVIHRIVRPAGAEPSPLRTLRQIAALVATLPTTHPTVTLSASSPEAVALLRGLPGALGGGHVSDRHGVIESVYVDVDGVQFHAQIARPATDEERAQLDGPTAWESSTRVADLPGARS